MRPWPSLSVAVLLSAAAVLLVGCDQANEFAEQAQKKINEATSSPPAPAETVPAATPAPANEVAALPTPPETPSPPPAPKPVDRAKVVAEFMSTAPEHFSDESFLALETFSADELGPITSLVIGTPRVTDKGLAVAVKFPALKSLSLHEMPVTPPMLAMLAQCENLEELSLRGASITDDALQELGPMIHLKSLNLEQATITDAALAVVPSLTDLEVLRLNKTAVTGAILLGKPKLNKLRVLEVSDTDFGPGLPYFKGLETLEELYASSTRINEENLATSGNWPALKALNLYLAKVSDKSVLLALKNSRKLEVVSFEGTEITNRTLGMLQYCKNLKELNARDTRVDNVGGNALQKILPAAKFFW